MNNKIFTGMTTGMIAALILVAYVGSGAMVVYSSTDDDDDDCRNWGECTKERTPLGDHASDPDEDGTPGNDNQNDPGSDNNNHRAGLGNVKKLCETTMKDLGNELNDGECPP
jgi:hypothetical protein